MRGVRQLRHDATVDLKRHARLTDGASASAGAPEDDRRDHLDVARSFHQQTGTAVAPLRKAPGAVAAPLPR